MSLKDWNRLQKTDGDEKLGHKEAENPNVMTVTFLTFSFAIAFVLPEALELD